HTVLGGILVHRTERARTIEWGMGTQRCEQSCPISKRKEMRAVKKPCGGAGIIVTALIVAATAGPTSGLAADGTVKVGVIEMLTAQSGPPDPKNNPRGWCWTMTTDPVAQATYTFQTLKAKKGWQRFVMVYDQDNGYVAFQRPNIRESAKAAGVDLQEVGIAAGTSDFGPQITRARNAN